MQSTFKSMNSSSLQTLTRAGLAFLWLLPGYPQGSPGKQLPWPHFIWTNADPSPGASVHPVPPVSLTASPRPLSHSPHTSLTALLLSPWTPSTETFPLWALTHAAVSAQNLLTLLFSLAILLLLHILVCSGCCNKLLKMERLRKNNSLSHLVLEAGRPRSTCWRIWGLMSTQLLTQEGSWPHDVLTRRKGQGHSLGSLRAQISFMSAPLPWA